MSVVQAWCRVVLMNWKARRKGPAGGTVDSSATCLATANRQAAAGHGTNHMDVQTQREVVGEGGGNKGRKYCRLGSVARRTGLGPQSC